MTPPSPRHAGAAARADAIEAELRRLGRWQASAPPPETFESRRAFFADTMAFEQWLQWVLLPRVREIAAEGGAFPARSQVGAHAVRELDGDLEAGELLRLLSEFDDYIEGAAERVEAGSGEAPAAAGPAALDAFAAALDAYRRDALPAEAAKIREALGVAVELDVDWASIGRGVPPDQLDRMARQWLPSRGVGDVRAALCLLGSDHGAAARRAVAAVLRRVRLRNVGPGEPTFARFAAGTLDVAVCLARGGARALDVGRVLVDALDLRAGPALARLREETIPAHQRRLQAQLDAPIAVELDADSFAAEADVDRRLAALHDCDQRGLYALCFALGAVAAHEPWRAVARARVTAVRVRHAPEAAGRELAAVGSTLVLGGSFGGDPDGCLDESEIEALLPGVLAGLPALAAPPATGDALAACRRLAAEAQGRISASLGGPVGLDVEWDALARDPAALAGLPARALQRLVGACALLAPALAAAPSAGPPALVRIRDVGRPGECACALAGGVLELRVCLAPRGTPAAEAGRAAVPADRRPGFFYEAEIARTVSDTLGLETAPLVASLRDGVVPDFTRWLNETLHAAIVVDVEWDGFLAGAPVEAQKWALQRLRQDVLEPACHALAGLAEGSRDFARLIRGRVRVLRVQHAPRPESKALLGQGHELLLRVFLHAGYDGLLTIDEMRERLPGLLAGMADGPPLPDPEDERPAPLRPGVEDDRGADGPPAAAADPRLAVLRGLVEVGLHQLEHEGVKAFVMTFVPPEEVVPLFADGGAPFDRLVAALTPKRDLLVWALRRCLAMTPEVTGDGRAVFRFADLPPGVTVAPLVFRADGERWLLDFLREPA